MILERIKALFESANWIPFILSAGAHHIEHRKLNFQRLLETLIMGMVSGVAAALIAFYVLQNDVNHLTKRVDTYIDKAEKIQEKNDNKINNFIREFDKHKHIKEEE